MQRRIVDYPASTGWTDLNRVSTLGSAILAVGVLVFVWAIWSSLRRREPAGDDPWGGYSLEWATSSPPPEHNFERLPRIRSERPAFDLRHPEVAAP